MTSTTPFRYQGADGVPLAAFRWATSDPPRAILQLAHGAGEHAGRYREPLAPVLAAGFAVYAADHRGHGLTSGMSHLGDFGPGGAPACVADMAELSKLARAENPGLPLVLIGHSMGAMFAQAYLLEHSGLIDALVLSGTTGPGPRLPGGPNSIFPNPRTAYDWLSRDEAEVDKYIADPLCGIQFSEASMASFVALRSRELSVEALAGVKRGLPVYVFVGDEDPINRRLEGLEPLIAAYRGAGLSVTLKAYPGGRHEMLNETNREDVVRDLLAWLEAHT
ncbi:alpha/beta fold hydrolase [Phenylobacterium sp.]|uniref:alpha/beta fold hydrolase n=1 Tax=Phenylobacterium sp. TaxID=1871053 RepID=UPI003982EC35